MASGKFETRHIPGKGRGLFASTTIPAGEIVGEFHPVVYNPAFEYRKHMCMVCLHNIYPKKLAERLPCGYGYCSEACKAVRKMAATFEQEKILIERIFKLCTAMEAPLVVTDTLAILQALYLHRTEPEKFFDSVYTLMGWEVEDIVPNVKEILQLRVDVIVQGLAAIGVRVAPDDEILWGVCTRFARNSLTYWDEDYNPGVVTLFDQASMFNHSCSPSVVKLSAINFPIYTAKLQNEFENDKRLFYGSEEQRMRAPHGIPLPLVFVAARDIHPGEELVISYLTSDCSDNERDSILQDYFGFQCNCPRCELRQLTTALASAEGISANSSTPPLLPESATGHVGCGGWWVPLSEHCTSDENTPPPSPEDHADGVKSCDSEQPHCVCSICGALSRNQKRV